MSSAATSYPIEAILYRRLTYTDWMAIHGKLARARAGGERHIALGSMHAESDTSKFLGTTTSPFEADFTAIGSLQIAPLEFKRWATTRMMWTVPDQFNHRHLAIQPANGFPQFGDARLWSPTVQRGQNWVNKVGKSNWLEKVIIYWVRCPGPTFFIGFLVDGSLPAGWPPVFTKMFSGKNTGLIEVTQMASLSPLALQVIQALAGGHRNILMYGPPGTGKTVAMQEVKEFLENPGGGGTSIAINPTNQAQPFQATSVAPPLPQPVYTDWLTFHQSMSYEEFVVGLRPVPAKGGITLEPRAGRLLEAVRALDGVWFKSAVLFIDEFNRGNPAQVFGEMITFLEADKRGQSIHLLGVNSDGADNTEEIQFKDGKDKLSYPLQIPEHLYVIASINSLDRSVAPLDQALARRFHRVPCPPDMAFLRDRLGLTESVEQIAGTDTAPSDEDKAGLTAAVLLNRINKYVRHLLGADFEFGHGYLNKVWGVPEGAGRWRELAIAWDASIFPQIEEMFRTRNNELSKILRVEEAAGVANFVAYPYKLEQPPANLEDQEPRVVYPASAVQSVVDEEERRRVLAFLASNA